MAQMFTSGLSSGSHCNFIRKKKQKNENENNNDNDNGATQNPFKEMKKFVVPFAPICRFVC
jgi:hypothetical protein